MRRAGGALAAPLATLALALGPAGCGDGDGRLTVLGAASLADVLPKVDPGPEYSFAASDALAAQVREGAPGDVYAAAGETLPNELYVDGLVRRPRVFATNRLVLLAPRANRRRVASVADLARPGVRFVMASEGVPAGDYTRAVLRNLGRADLIGRAASNEADVRAVATKVALGEADAGFVYATDAAAFGDRVREITLPERAQPPIRYAVAVVAASDHPDEARRFVDALAGPRGRAALREAGFGPP